MNAIIKEEIKKVKDLKSLEDLKKSINEELDTREKVINLCNEANELKGVKNFGFIKESMEEMSNKLFETKSGRSQIKRYISEIKSNKTLASLHSLFEGLRKLSDPNSVNELIKEWDSSKHFNKKEYNSGINELGTILSESFILSGADFNDIMNADVIKYNDTVMSIVENKRKNDLGDYFNKIKMISENISNRPDSSKLNEDILNFNENIYTKISELSNGEINEEKYNQCKNNCIDSLNETKRKLESEGDAESCNKIEVFIEGIENKSFNIDTAKEDMNNFKELSECFK